MRLSTRLKRQPVWASDGFGLTCPPHRPEALHKLLHSMPNMPTTQRLEKKLEGTGTPTSISRFLLMDADELRRQLGLVFSRLLELDDYCQGVAPPHPVYAAELATIIGGRVPASWLNLLPLPSTAPPSGSELQTWINFVSTRSREVEKAVSSGSKALSLGVGCFPSPKGFFTALKLEGMATLGDDAVFVAEVSTREREHLREPPGDGFLLHNAVLHGCGWDGGEAKETGRFNHTHLPVLHVFYSAPKQDGRPDDKNNKVRAARGDSDTKRKGTFRCPVYHMLGDTNTTELSPIFTVSIPIEDVELNSTWNLRGVCATLL